MYGKRDSNFVFISFQVASHPYNFGSQAHPCGICVGQSSTGTRFPQLSRVPLSVLLDQCDTLLLSNIYFVCTQPSESVVESEQLGSFLHLRICAPGAQKSLLLYSSQEVPMLRPTLKSELVPVEVISQVAAVLVS